MNITIEQRRKNIDTLKIFNDNVFEVIENVQYGIKFESGKHKFTMLIRLDQQFPLSIPTISITPKVKNLRIIHPWMEGDEVRHAPGILNFTQNSDLGRVCQAIIREFEKHPPSLVPVAEIKHIIDIPELQTMSVKDLQVLLTNDQEMDDLIEDRQEIIQLNTIIDEIIEENEQIAINNLNRENKLRELESSVELKTYEIVNRGVKFEEQNSKFQKECDEKYSPSHIIKLLQKAESEVELKCDEIAESFLNNETPVNEFLDKFISCKKLLTIRKFKEERLSDQLQQLNAYGKFQ